MTILFAVEKTDWGSRLPLLPPNWYNLRLQEAFVTLSLPLSRLNILYFSAPTDIQPRHQRLHV